MSTLDITVIGARLARQREALGLDQLAVAKRAGLSRPYISRLERGIVPNPKIQDIASVACALETPLSSLVTPTAPGRELVFAEVRDVLAQIEAAAGDDAELAEALAQMVRASLAVVRRQSGAR